MKKNPWGRDKRHVVADSCRLCLENTEHVGQVDKANNHKNDNHSDRNIHSVMNIKPPTENVACLYFFFNDECN